MAGNFTQTTILAEVLEHEGEEHYKPENVYEFSNGRKFKSTDRAAAGVYTVTLGDELVTDPNMQDSSDWTIQTGWSMSAGRARANDATSNFFQANSITNGTTYQVIIEIDGYVKGTVNYASGTTKGTLRSSNGTFTQNVTQDSATGGNIILQAVGFTGNIRYLSVREVL